MSFRRRCGRWIRWSKPALSTLVVLSATGACVSSVHPNHDIDTQTAAFKQARAGGLLALQQKIKYVIADRTVFATASSDTCSAGYQTLETGKSPYQWSCDVKRSAVIGVPGKDRFAAFVVARPMLQARGCDDVGVGEPEDFPWIDQPVGEHSYGFGELCRPPTSAIMYFISINHPKFTSIIRNAANGINDLVITRQDAHPDLTSRRLGQAGFHYALVVETSLHYYDVPW